MDQIPTNICVYVGGISLSTLKVMEMQAEMR